MTPAFAYNRRMMYPAKPSQRAFTLVELAIVLVIIGLIIGGVLVGQSMIRAAQLRAVTTQFQKFTTATQNFKDKYQALPGDMVDAATIWGAADGSGGNTAGCLSTVTTGSPLTCNGNGNGQIDAATSSAEYFRFWQHLNNAGFIEGSFTGVKDGTAQGSATTNNSPAGKIPSSLWFPQYLTAQNGAGTNAFAGQYGNILMFGGVNANNIPNIQILKPEEAYQLDLKLDDGQPATGTIVPFGNIATCTNASSGTSMTATYQLSSSSLLCTLVFRNLF